MEKNHSNKVSNLDKKVAYEKEQLKEAQEELKKIHQQLKTHCEDKETLDAELEEMKRLLNIHTGMFKSMNSTNFFSETLKQLFYRIQFIIFFIIKFHLRHLQVDQRAVDQNFLEFQHYNLAARTARFG